MRPDESIYEDWVERVAEDLTVAQETDDMVAAVVTVGRILLDIARSLEYMRRE